MKTVCYLLFTLSMIITSCGYQQSIASKKINRIPAAKKKLYRTVLERIDSLKSCTKTPRKKFNREKWGDWIQLPGDCQTMKDKLLIRDHKGRGEVKLDDNQCRVIGGQWKDHFGKAVRTTDAKGKTSVKLPPDIRNASPEHLNVTFIVPLSNVYMSGGKKWNKKHRETYINYVIEKSHHITVNPAQNRVRGAKHPGEYLPDRPDYKCEYVGAWIKTKKDWDLCITEEERSSLEGLAIQCKENYDRDQWKHWTDDEKDCLDSRQEALIRDSDGPVLISKEKGKCKIKTGLWIDSYAFDKNSHESQIKHVITDPHLIDVDHLVPLKNAHVSGGWAWPSEKKERFANKLKVKFHLLSVSGSENRSKGAKGPEEYMPPSTSYRCQYLRMWKSIKSEWSLEMNESEEEKVAEGLKACRKKEFPSLPQAPKEESLAHPTSPAKRIYCEFIKNWKELDDSYKFDYSEEELANIDLQIEQCSSLSH